MAQLLRPVFTSSFKKQYKKLPPKIQAKFTKQLEFLLLSYRHPSLAAKKMSGLDRYEARIDIHYRFTFEIEKREITFRTIGQHDKGLGKK